MSESSHQICKQINHKGITIPTFLYGTASKEDQTEALTLLALESGLMGIDTANQRRHYYEAGLARPYKKLCPKITNSAVIFFIQTKFTYAAGQDHRLPFDPNADYTTQVRQSFESSLDKLNVDSYILHGPASCQGLNDTDCRRVRLEEALDKFQAGLDKKSTIKNYVKILVVSLSNYSSALVD